MQRYLVRRLLGTIPVLFVSSILIFLIIHLIPGDPVYGLLPPNPSDEQVAAVRAKYGFDQPLYEQYVVWMSLVFQGDLGTSISNGWPVGRLLRLKFAVTLQLALAGFVVALITALPIGITAGLRPRGMIARFMGVYTTLGFAVPNFWIGILLILLFGVWLGVLPTSGFRSFTEDPVKALRYIVLPAFVLSIATSVIIANFLRHSVEEVVKSEFVTAAVAKGLPAHRILTKHILKNALIPVVTVATLQLGLMLAGTVITESLFGIPGMGRLIVDAISARDYAVVQGTLLFIVIIFIVLNFVTDLLYTWLDPRIRFN
jgi:peptide/nickel transport system permease protein